MNLDQLKQGLEQAFYTEQHRIVFWYDAEQSCSEEVKSLKLNDVQILNMAEESSLAIKLKLELEDQQGKYLLYFPSAEPETEKTGYWTSSCIHAASMPIVSRLSSMSLGYSNKV